MQFLKTLKAFFTPSKKNLWVFDAEDQAKASADYRRRLKTITHPDSSEESESEISVNKEKNAKSN